jgi:hypothetical protein
MLFLPKIGKKCKKCPPKSENFIGSEGHEK